ncbi:TIGR03960 family B12-binding radical SAM protein [Egibacter rhizosphaerae]|uniref:TIGR03960 family B12-binding radical SAM protein n=1 Tax=Egibacter rhizosphaerae TaxID=1670831 RepID=A0A411YBV0_9ACTN|nr:TIGR03960 family B12-binding radical SAM protein [Egibacter rhizosphaerae]QBI18658.1 TIGR03960 family B12-binding radical SAM protein [Egibacter rhizosphaerae]
MPIDRSTGSVWECLEPLLTQVRKPARYVGGETNIVVKEHGEVDSAWLLVYPDTYEVGQPNQGIQILYEVLNERPRTLAERGFAPWGDMEAVMRAHGLPFFSVETHRPPQAFDVLGFSLATEVGYTNLLNILDLGGVTRHATARADDEPLVIAGGHAVFNPEPLASFLDLAIAGDGEEVARELDGLVQEWRSAGDWSREHLLGRAARIEGVYVPRFYEPRYGPDGRLEATEPVRADARRAVPKRTLSDLDEWPYPKKQLVPLTETVHERYSVEIFRGCTRGCRFCQAGMITRPVRERSRETIKEMVSEGLENSGLEEVGLLSLSSADHSDIRGLCGDLGDQYEGTNTSLSLPSTRVDAFNVELADELTRNGRRTGLTFAPEAGTERMRKVINKTASEQDMLQAAETAFANGWRHIKLYFMIGLPTETDEDVLGIAELGLKVLALGKRHGRKNKVTVSVGGFIPKPHTPFQWCAQDPPEEIKRKIGLIKERVAADRNLNLRYHDPEPGVVEGLLSRGDRRVAAAVERAFELGARFDGWAEVFDPDRWRRACADTGVDLDWYLYRDRDEGEGLPWDHMDSGLDKSWLWEDYQDSLHARELDDCRWIPCYDCGVCPGLDIDHQTGYAQGDTLGLLPIVRAGTG